MASRRIDVFFYGLFMDAYLLRTKGGNPTNIRPASVPGFALRIGQRATLVPNPNGLAHGILMELTHAEVEQLYSDSSVRAYRPEAVLCELRSGSRVPALCFNLVEPPRPDEANSEYAAKLRGPPPPCVSFLSTHSSGHRMVHLEFGQDRLTQPHPLNTFELP